VRADPKAAKRLVEAGEELEAAQKAALRGEGKPELKRAMAGQQEAVENMIEAVREALGSGQASPATLDRARETLRAVASDEELRAEFTTARVAADKEAVGFGGATSEVAPRAPKRRRKAPSAARRREAERELKRVERSLDAAEKQVEKRRSGLDKARQALEAAEEELAEAERQRVRLEAEAERAREALSALEEDD
jgi:chromosome segregation ATPase